jgi:peroxiredoxin
MTLTPSKMMDLGSIAPDFSLHDTISGAQLSLADLKSEVGTVIMFICNHCPYVKHIQKTLVEVAIKYQEKGINFIAISSNDAQAYPADNTQKMAEEAFNNHYPFPYLYDQTQEVAKAYDAACTPDFYIFDSELECVYRGQFDDSRPSNDITVTGESVTQALDCLLAGKPIDSKQRPSLGCSIKWKEQ